MSSKFECKTIMIVLAINARSIYHYGILVKNETVMASCYLELLKRLTNRVHDSKKHVVDLFDETLNMIVLS